MTQFAYTMAAIAAIIATIMLVKYGQLVDALLLAGVALILAIAASENDNNPTW